MLRASISFAIDITAWWGNVHSLVEGPFLLLLLGLWRKLGVGRVRVWLAVVSSGIRRHLRAAYGSWRSGGIGRVWRGLGVSRGRI